MSRRVQAGLGQRRKKGIKFYNFSILLLSCTLRELVATLLSITILKSELIVLLKL